MPILNTPADLVALKGTPDYAAALQILLGSTQTWVNQAPDGSAPNWQMVSALSTIQAMGFMSVDELLAECAAVGVAAPPAPSAPAPPLAQIAAALVASGTAATAAIVAQIFPDPARQAAFQNAASILNGNGGVAPTTAPLAAAFASLAAAYATSPANFAAFVLTGQAASLNLSAAQATLTAAAKTATMVAELDAALAAFQTAIDAIVTSLDAALPTPLAAPAPIRVAGLNA